MRPQVIGGFQALAPSRKIHLGYDRRFRLRQEKVHGLRLVDPFLPARSGIDNVFVKNSEGGLVFLFQFIRYLGDVCQFTIIILELVNHVPIPKVVLLEVAHQGLVQDNKAPGKVALCEEVLEQRLNAWGTPHDVGDRGRWRYGKNIAVAHALLADLVAQACPVHLSATLHINRLPSLLLQEVQ